MTPSFNMSLKKGIEFETTVRIRLKSPTTISDVKVADLIWEEVKEVFERRAKKVPNLELEEVSVKVIE